MWSGGAMWASPPTRFYRKMVRRGRCLHRPGGTDFQIVRRWAAPSPTPGVVPHLRRREGTPPYGVLSVNGPNRTLTAPRQAARALPCKNHTVGRHPCVPPHTSLPAKCHCEGAPRPWQSVPLAPHLRLFLRRLPFFLQRMKTANFRSLLSQRFCV